MSAVRKVPPWRDDVARLNVGYACLHAAMSGTRMTASLWALGEGYGAGGAGALVALFAVAQIGVSLPAGRHADRYGLGRPLAWSVAGASVGIGAAALHPSFVVLCACALLCGGGCATVLIALQRHLGQSAGSAAKRVRVFSWLSIAPAVANFVGPLIAGFAIDHGGFRAAFLALAVLPIALWALGRNVPEVGGSRSQVAHPGRVADLLRDTPTRSVLVMNLLMTASGDLHAFMVPVLGFQRDITASGIGIVLGAFAIATAVIRLMVPAIASRIAEWKLITLSVAAAGLVLIAYPFTDSLATMAACSLALGAVYGSVQPNVMTILHRVTPRHRQAEAFALRLIMVNVSALGMPLLLGVTLGTMGAGAVFWFVGATMCAGSTVGLGLRGRSSPSDPDEGGG